MLLFWLGRYIVFDVKASLLVTCMVNGCSLVAADDVWLPPMMSLIVINIQLSFPTCCLRWDLEFNGLVSWGGGEVPAY